MKKVGIIIINWNSLRLGYAEGLVETLNEIEYPKDFFTIFVADNKSDDGSPDYIEKNLKNVKVIRNDDNLGFAEGNNIVVDMCIEQGYDYVYLLNHDTEVESDFLTKAVEYMESDPSIGSVQSRLMLYQEDGVVNSIGNAIHFLGFGYSKGGYDKITDFSRDKLDKKEIAYASGAGVLLNLDVIKKVGLFDTNFFMYHEDLDLGWKIQMAGYKNILCWDSVVYHKYEFSSSVKKYYYMERNRYIVLFENMRVGTLVVLFPFLFAFELGTLLFSLKSGFWKEKVKVYPYFFKPSSWIRISHHRRQKKKFRKVKDKEILKTFSGTISNQHIDNALLNQFVNPIADTYFRVVKTIMFW